MCACVMNRSIDRSAGPKLEDFLGAAQSQAAMALSLDNAAASSFYYYGGAGGGHHQGSSFLQPCVDLYGGPSAASLVGDDEAAAAATAMASWVAARAESGVLSAAGQHQHHHALALSMSSGSLMSSCVTAHPGEYGMVAGAAMDGGRKRGGAAGGQKQPVHHRKSIDTFGQRTSQYRGVTRYTHIARSPRLGY